MIANLNQLRIYLYDLQIQPTIDKPVSQVKPYISPLQDTKLTEDLPAHFEVHYETSVKPNVQWFYNGQLITRESHWRQVRKKLMEIFVSIIE